MDYSAMLSKFEVLLSEQFKNKIFKAGQDNESLVVEFQDIEKFDTELSDAILETPEECLRAADEALRNVTPADEDSPRITFRVRGLHESNNVAIKNLRSKHIGLFVAVDGIIKQASEVRPEITAATFECKACGQRLTILQEEPHLKTPFSCECGNRRGFELVIRKLIDIQRLELEEVPERLDGGAQPRKIGVFLRDDLVDPRFQKKVVPGSKVQITGILNDAPMKFEMGKETKRRDIYVDANYLESIELEFEDLEITPEDEKKIKELAHDPKIYDTLVKSIAPSIYGYEEIKLAIALQLFGGVRKVRPDGVTTRGDIHIFLVGDPGSGKSQLLKYVTHLAPKARYVVGKSASGAGMTATVVKDEFLRGWALEAGALVLANKGLCAIDELDKMGKEDRSAMHEVMEQQCYHPDTRIVLGDGRNVKIGLFVEELMKKNMQNVYAGKDCEILPVDGLKIQTTDMKSIFSTNINRVSRHRAPKKMYIITYSNGRSICVTPEHPAFVCTYGEIKEMRADKVTAGMLAPAPRFYHTQPKEKIMLKKPERWHPNLKNISFPEVLDKKLAEFLGYLVSEGHIYRNTKNRYAEIGITNSNKQIIQEVHELWNDVFNIQPNILVQNSPAHNNACEVQILRCPSQLMYEFFQINFPEIMTLSVSRAVPQKIRMALPLIQKAFLKTMFLGDGFADSERFGYITASYTLAKDLQDILLNNNIWSYIAKDVRPAGTYYKVVVSGKDSIRQFTTNIVSANDTRAEKIEKLAKRAENRANSTDIMPVEIVQKLCILLREYHMLDGYFDSIIKKEQGSNRIVVKKYVDRLEKRLSEISHASGPKNIRKTSAIPARQIARELGVSASTIYHIEIDKSHEKYDALLCSIKKLEKEKCEKTSGLLKEIKDFVFADIRFVSIKKVELIENHGLDWVYDVTVEPTKTFLSEGLVLHNTVTISKANVQATLHAQTTILAAANPKFGRFDAYESIPKQIDLPETLLSRFDLTFPVRDIPDKEKDTRLVRHILRLHENPEVQDPPIDSEMLRKYIAYAKSNIKPKLTKVATKEIELFYVGLRSSASKEGENSAVPIGARQLEALIRLSEASAKIRLADKIAKEDAKRAIDIVTKCLMEVGIDPETGKFDIDRLESGTTSTQRNKLKIILSLVGEMQEESPEKTVLINDVIAAAEDQGIESADEIIQKLKTSGELFEPKQGHIRKV